MKGSSKFSLAIALALAAGNVFALGLGSIQLKSRLDQPLIAEIPVIAANPSELAGLKVGLASAEDFQRVGLDRSRVSIPLEFAVGTNGSGETVIKVTTKDPVREPFLDFLIEADWSKGRVLREYTVLLDPPVMAPAVGGSAAHVSPAHEAPAPAQPHKLSNPHRAKPKPARVMPPHTVAHHAKPAKKPKPAPKPVAAKKTPAPARSSAESGQYGPVAQGETLTAIARATRPSESTNMDAYMLAMLKANPNAFFKDNINALKRGAILRIPSAEDIHASGTAAEAAAAVRAQNQAWGAGAPVAKPTLVAKAGAPKPKKSTPAKKPAKTPTKTRTASARARGGHLALVPPSTSKNGKATADHPGSASGTGNAANSAELARTKEALTSREQEVGELKSRVKELEDIHNKDQRLLSMKDSELADLQAKLKKLQSGTAAAATPAAPIAAPAAVKPAESAPTKAEQPANGKTPAKITAKDIWGDINAGQTTSSKTPANAQPTPTTGQPKPAATSMPASPTTAKSAVAATSSVSAAAQTAVSTSAPKPANAATKPARPAPPKQKPASKPRRIPSPESPWYMNNNVLYGGGAILVLIGLILLMRIMRRPKLQPRPATSTAGLGAGFDMPAEDTAAAEERNLLERLSQNPSDSEASVELLSLYYANGDADKFEAAAEDMYAHIADPNQPEWQQVRAMGEELCPHNPLFGGTEDLAATAGYMHESAEPDHTHVHEPEPATHLDAGLHDYDDAVESPEHAFDLGAEDEPVTTAHAHEEDDGFDFDLTEQATPAPAPPPPPAPSAETAHDEAETVAGGVTLPDLPPLELESEPAAEPETKDEIATPVAPVAVDEEPIASEDAIGTKLDLAKAYLDMGDPEGARSMLDEVLAEGNDAQKDEARKLLDEIH